MTGKILLAPATKDELLNEYVDIVDGSGVRYKIVMEGVIDSTQFAAGNGAFASMLGIKEVDMSGITSDF